VAWVAFRHPNVLAGALLDFDLNSDRLEVDQQKLKAALEDILQEMRAGTLSVQARSVREGTVSPISAGTISALEFHIATDIPGCPCGFRNTSDHVLEWVEPTVLAAQIMSQWLPLAGRTGSEA